MDDIVRAALAKWPDVPACFGWLRLTRRGEWCVPDGPIRHAGLSAFIGRNYEADTAGRWFFQNGPQQVFVRLDYTPFILRLASPDTLVTHTGQPVADISAAWLDDEGSLLLACEHGIGLLEDRDLAAFCSHLDGNLESVDGPLSLNWGGRRLAVSRIARTEVPARFGFVAEPS